MQASQIILMVKILQLEIQLELVNPVVTVQQA